MIETKSKYEPGAILSLGDTKFVVLDNDYNGEGDLFVLTLETQGDCVFGKDNNYAKSDLCAKIGAWYRNFAERTFGGRGPTKVRTLDLTTLDGQAKYAALMTSAAPLTLDEVRKYAKVIPSCNNSWWLATGCEGPAYETSYEPAFVLYVRSSGSRLYSNSCASWNGIRPALVLDPALLKPNSTECDGTESSAEKDTESKGKHNPGDIVELCGTKFAVLDNDYEGEGDLLIQAVEAQGKTRFGETNCYGGPSCYKRSDLCAAVRNWYSKFVRRLRDAGADPSLIRNRMIDLTTLDGRGRYIHTLTCAAPLTLDEVRKYAEVIPPCDMPWWLSTGWSGYEELGASLALGMLPNGALSGYFCSYEFGVRPVLTIDPALVNRKR